MESRSWQIRLTLDVDDEGRPLASVETSRLDGRSHTWHGRVTPGAVWTFTDVEGAAGWPGRLEVRLEPLEDAGDHEPHTSS